MENQHRKIKGYRELSQEEIDLMNEIKTKGIELAELVAKVKGHIHKQYTQVDNLLKPGDVYNAEMAAAHVERERLNAADSYRWLAIAKTDFQTGLMALTRTVAQPETF